MEAADVELLYRWRTDPEVSRFMYTSGPASPAEHEAWFAAAAIDGPAHRHRMFVDGTTAVGLASLTNIDTRLHRSCSWGGYIDPASHGRGLGATLLVLSMRMAFDDLSLERVWVEAMATNDRAIALYEQTGFRREAFFRSFVWRSGTPLDVVGLALLRKEWLTLYPRQTDSQPGGGA
nr:UDP-4-amino-4,6-dideoxy-N-acetyl-beta-L-altrosamine N-acetyltransferase [Rhabdothermincola salaria]